jgi:glutathione S-transferase
MPDDQQIVQQIEHIRQQLSEEKHNNQQRNKELQANLHYLARDLDTLFASKTWKLGYGIMNLYRKIMNLFGKRHDGQYMNADHFKNLLDNCEFYSHRKTRIHPTLADTLAGKYPKNHYEPSQVETVLKDLWHIQKADKNDR